MVLIAYASSHSLCIVMVSIWLYFRRSSTANSVIGGHVWGILLLIQACMIVLDTCKTEEHPFKNEGARVVIKRSPIVRSCRFFLMLKGS